MLKSKFRLSVILLVAFLSFTVAVLVWAKVDDRPKESRAKSQRQILMMGRSVMAGWFNHWGSDTSTPVKHGRFTLKYGELNSPPDIVKSAKTRMNAFKPSNPIFFFKLCFVDFDGSSREEAKKNLARNESYVKEVYKYVAKRKGAKLIVGSALPQVAQNTTPNLVWNHTQYDIFLSKFAKKNKSRVSVFNLHGILADREGNLSAAYAVSPDDSHLNSVAYAALDKSYFKFLSNKF